MSLYVCYSFRGCAAADSSNLQHYASTELPNTALLTMVLVLGTFYIAYLLRLVRNSKFFGRQVWLAIASFLVWKYTIKCFDVQVREVLGEVGLALAILIMALIDNFALHDSGLTSHLCVRAGMQPTLAGRDWLVTPLLHLYWLPIACSVPGVLVFLVVFVEVEATQ